MNGEEIKGNYGSVSFLNRKIKNQNTFHMRVKCFFFFIEVNI